MASSVESDEIPKHLLCPVCFEIPPAVVYQCRDGHMLCQKCYNRIEKCPQCRDPLDKIRPIRNRPIEKVMDDLQINCSFKSFGCNKILSRKIVQLHQKICCFDFTRFGSFVNICKHIGYPYCNFEFNNGNVKPAVEHFVSQHGCILTSAENFTMELTSFLENATPNASSCPSTHGFRFWTPIIVDLKKHQCFLLTMTILNKSDASFTWLSIFLPYLTNKTSQTSPVRVEYAVQMKDNSRMSFLSEPISLSKACKMLPNKIRLTFFAPYFVQDCSENGSLPIDCNIKGTDVAASSVETRQNLVCANYIIGNCVAPIRKYSTGNCLLRFHRGKANPSVKKFRDEIKQKCKNNRRSLLPILQKLFEGGTPRGSTMEDLKWLKTDLVFLVAEFGSEEDLKYVNRKGVSTNIADENGRSLFHYTMLDENKEIGLEKAKLLVESVGVDDDNWNAIHYAACFSTNEAVEFFLQKGCHVNAVDKFGLTPLHVAVYNDNEGEGVKIGGTLLLNGADANIRDEKGLRAINHAVNKGKIKFKNLIQSYQ